LIDPIRNNITYHANGCVAIIEAVATGQVDVAFGWTSFRHLEPERIEIIELPREQQVLRGTCVGLLSFARQPEKAEQFLEFLASPASRRCYREHGWVIPAE
jgi:accessory colonization factor AcfC